MQSRRKHGKSFVWRFIASVSVFLFFAVTVLALAGVLLAVPPVLAYLTVTGNGHSNVWGHLLIFAACWGSAFVLLRGLLSARRARFAPRSEPLRRRDAPKLFALLDDLGRSCGTAPPVDVYLAITPELGVLETGGFMGFGTRRVLLIGAPLLVSCSIDELRAALAHELGHFVGGDTRLAGILAFTENAFRGILEAVNAPRGGGSHIIFDVAADFSRFVGRTVVRLFVRFYLWATRPSARRQELDADVLAAELAGRDVTVRMLEQAHFIDVLYAAYLERDIERALARDVVPTDVLGGFVRFRTRCRERGVEAEIGEAFAKVKTDPFDTHPALAERVDRLRELDAGARTADDRPGTELLASTFDLERWVTREVSELADARMHRRRRSMPWDEFTTTVIPASLRELADKFQKSIGGRVGTSKTATERFAALVDAYEAGYAPAIAALVEPNIQALPPESRDIVTRELAASILGTFFQAALLERGSEVIAFLGEPCTLHRFEGETVPAGNLASAAMQDDAGRAALRAWAERLAARQRTQVA
jgi:Zn-dependent protease with chaperone function